MEKCIIVDLDNTVALRNNRKPYEYNKTHTDSPNVVIINLINILKNYYTIIICTGREKSTSTYEWLSIHLPYYKKIYFRKNKDYRKDSIVKEEMWEDINKEYKIEFMIDDRKQVIDRARELGYTVLDIAGNTF